MDSSKPIPSPDYYWTPADTPLHVEAPGLLANDYHPDGLPLEAVNLYGNLELTHGMLHMHPWRNDGSFDYYPFPGHNGRDTFSYYCVDPVGWYIETLVTIDVGIFNRAPFVVEPLDDVTVDQGVADTVIDLTPVFDDLDISRGDELTYSVVVSPPILPIVEEVSQSNYEDIHQNMLYTRLGDSRGYGSVQHDLARDNIYNYFQSLGLTTTYNTIHEYTDVFNSTMVFDPPLVNVVGVKFGTTYPEDAYLVTAHYDSVHNPGADDNASGVAAVMEMARVLSAHTFESTLVFVAFDGEEDGLFGSAYYAEFHYSDHNVPGFSSELMGMVNLDMIAYNHPGEDYNVVSIFDLDDKGNAKPNLVSAFAKYGGGVIGRNDGIMGMSDHEPFEFFGFDAVLVIETGVFSNPHYHLATDSFETPDYIDYAYATKITGAVTGYLAQSAKPLGTVDALTAEIVDDQLVLSYDPSKSGGAVVTVRATDLEGLFAESFFLITVNPTAGPSVTVNDRLLSDSDVGADKFTVTVLFPEPMDIAVTPTLSFTPDHQGTLATGRGDWSTTTNTNDTYTVTYDVTDRDVEIFDIQIGVAGARDAAGNDHGDDSPRAEFSIDTLNPRVTNVWVRGSGWTQDFLDHLATSDLGHATHGYAIPVGSSAQLHTLPWFNVDTVAIEFSEDVSAERADLNLWGVTVAQYDFAEDSAGFAYDATNHVATWTLAQTLNQPDKLLIDLRGDATGVTDGADNLLDGAWIDQRDTYPSGNGTPGTDFRFRFNVLPGDVDQNGRVLTDDWRNVRNNMFNMTGDPDYSAFHDVDGNGWILTDDWRNTRARMFDMLPDGDPSDGSGNGNVAGLASFSDPTSPTNPVTGPDREAPNQPNGKALIRNTAGVAHSSPTWPAHALALATWGFHLGSTLGGAEAASFHADHPHPRTVHPDPHVPTFKAASVHEAVMPSAVASGTPVGTKPISVDISPRYGRNAKFSDFNERDQPLDKDVVDALFAREDAE